MKFLTVRAIEPSTKIEARIEQKLHPHSAYMTGFVRVMGNPGVLLLCLQKLGMQGIEVANVEAVQDASLQCGPPQVVGVWVLQHPVVARRAHIDSAHAQCADEVQLH